MKIEITSTELRSFTIEGRTYNQQTGWFHLPSAPYPVQINLTVEAPYPPGEYVVDLAGSLVVRKNKLQLGRLKLKPMSGTISATVPVRG